MFDAVLNSRYMDSVYSIWYTYLFLMLQLLKTLNLNQKSWITLGPYVKFAGSVKKLNYSTVVMFRISGNFLVLLNVLHLFDYAHIHAFTNYQ